MVTLLAQNAIKKGPAGPFIISALLQRIDVVQFFKRLL